MSATKDKAPGLKLGRIAGVPVYLAYSWFLITAVITVVFGMQLQRAQWVPAPTAYLLGFTCSIMIALAVLIHEVAHAMVARHYKWPDAHIVLTLWGGHTQFGSFKATPGASLAVALAGPLSNFVIAGAGWLVNSLVELPFVPGAILNFVIYANLLLGVFNILPGLPLDGGRLVESAVWKATGSQERGTIAASWVGRAIAVGIVIWFAVIPLVSGRELEMTTLVIGVMVALFMWQSTTGLIAHSKLRMRLPALKAGSLMSPASGMGSSATVADIRHRLAQRGGQIVLVSPQGMPIAVVDQGALSAVPESAAAQTPATAISRALGNGAVIADDADGDALIHYLATVETAEYAVINDEGYIVGVLHQEQILRALNVR
ncbi:site-2 protease family protein [Glutamicibacter sp. MNS18]|uniref:site-2 protease family protein n=1 Tax=Glutamicibacter sp. MNS18 TaxID=2989817 RepID=UPI002235FBA3|nr:site-2 protease family protein [Glutamicibacter sp. MNS18]MCW4464899.1 site-2 protease family protein [Glutamicibacter sp. MNS18]